MPLALLGKSAYICYNILLFQNKQISYSHEKITSKRLVVYGSGTAVFYLSIVFRYRFF